MKRRIFLKTIAGAFTAALVPIAGRTKPLPPPVAEPIASAYTHIPDDSIDAKLGKQARETFDSIFLDVIQNGHPRMPLDKFLRPKPFPEEKGIRVSHLIYTKSKLKEIKQ